MRVLLASLLLLTSCMQEPDKTTSSEEAFRLVEEQSQIQASTEGYAGSGKMIAKSIFRSPRTNAHWLIRARLPLEDSRLSLYLFFDDFSHNTGLELQLRRQQQSIEVLLAEPGRPLKLLTEIHEALDGEDRFRLRLETHNAIHNHRRIFIWNDWSFWGEDHLRTREFISASTAAYDSEASGKVIYSWGTGIHWGLELFKVQELSIRRETSYVSH